MTVEQIDEMLFGSLGDKQSLSPREVAQAVGVSLRTVYNWAEEDKITSTALGNGTLRIVRRSVVVFYHQGLQARKDKLTAENPAQKENPESRIQNPEVKKKETSPPRKSGWIRRY